MPIHATEIPGSFNHPLTHEAFLVAGKDPTGYDIYGFKKIQVSVETNVWEAVVMERSDNPKSLLDGWQPCSMLTATREEVVKWILGQTAEGVWTWVGGAPDLRLGGRLGKTI